MKKMKDAMWRVDSVSGSKFRDPRDPNQLAFDLSDGDPNLTLLLQQIRELLDESPKTSLSYSSLPFSRPSSRRSTRRPR